MDYKERRNFVGYEYKEVSASSDKVSLLLDGYESFGWEVDDNFTLNVPQRSARVSAHVPMPNGKDYESHYLGNCCWNHWDCIYGGIGFCCSGTDTADPFVYCFSNSGIYRVDSPILYL